MAPTPAQTANGYHSMWDRAHVLMGKRDAANHLADRVVANRSIYESVQKRTGVPWYMVAAIHNRESGLSFKGHLHNGDSLTARTYHVPAGRPVTGSPPFKWDFSADDALTMPPHSLDRVKVWSIERVLYECEKYNGWGYLGKNNSPYIWSWTDEQQPGKYVADGQFSRTTIDVQAGVVAIFKVLEERKLLEVSVRENTPPADVVEKETRKARTVAKAGASGAAVGGTGEAVKTSGTLQAVDNHNTSKFITYPLIGLGLGVLIAAAIVIAVKNIKLTAKWG